jgi:SAM-dependent methyltransferase
LGLKNYLNSLYSSATYHNQKNILDFAKIETHAKILDLGCDDGAWTQKIAQAANAKNIFGIEIIASAAEKAKALGVQVEIGDLKNPLPYPSNFFDLVHANQVIEHVPDIDLFLSESLRVLRPGGRIIVSTENGSSWHNIFAAIMGWQIFSLTNLSSVECGVGNPLALHRGRRDFASSWTHKVIFNYRGLIEFCALHGVGDIQVKGAGYHPLPTFFATLDCRHSHFLTVTGIKT